MAKNKWVTGAMPPLNGVITLLVPGRGPPCKIYVYNVGKWLIPPAKQVVGSQYLSELSMYIMVHLRLIRFSFEGLFDKMVSISVAPYPPLPLVIAPMRLKISSHLCLKMSKMWILPDEYVSSWICWWMDVAQVIYLNYSWNEAYF